MTDRITIDTEYPISISTTRPVSISTQGGETTVRIEGSGSEWADFAEREYLEAQGLAMVPREPDPAEALLPEVTSRMHGPRCGVIMKRSGKPCARVEGHNGGHMNAQQVKNKQKYNKDAARERYKDDEEYREHVRSVSRDSYARRTGGPDAE